jgi:hypothetical protein
MGKYGTTSGVVGLAGTDSRRPRTQCNILAPPVSWSVGDGTCGEFLVGNESPAHTQEFCGPPQTPP